MRRGEHDRRGAAGLVGFEPARRAYAPAIARSQSREAELGRREVVSSPAAEGEKSLGDDRADGMAADVLGPCRAAPVAEEAGQRLGRALQKRPANHVPVWFSGHAHILNGRDRTNLFSGLSIEAQTDLRFSGRVAGPSSTAPSTSKREPWHGQSQLRSAALNRTRQPRWVQRS